MTVLMQASLVLLHVDPGRPHELWPVPKLGSVVMSMILRHSKTSIRRGFLTSLGQCDSEDVRKLLSSFEDKPGPTFSNTGVFEFTV
jgi:hypothetical protein